MHSCQTNRIPPIHTQNPALSAMLQPMAAIKGRSGPPGNQNVFRHGLAAVQQRRANGSLNSTEQSIREEPWLACSPTRAVRHRSAPPCACWQRSSRVMCPFWLPSIKPSRASSRTNEGESKSQGTSVAGWLQKTACRFSIGESPAVRDGKGRQIGIASGNHRRDDGR